MALTKDEYLEYKDAREERELKLLELKTLVEVLSSLPINVRESVRIRIEKLVRELV